MRQTLALLWLLLCLTLSLPVAASAGDLYVADGSSNSISGFSVGGEGALSPIECGDGCKTQSEPGTLAISPNGKFVFVAERGPGSENETVSSYSIGAGGALSEVECHKHCTATEEPAGIATTPDGKYVYVARSDAHAIATFSVGPSGALTKVACSPSSECETHGDGRPVGLAVSPDGKFLYATTVIAAKGKHEPEPGFVSVFSIAAGGALAPVPCGGCETGLRPTGITITPSGQYLYVANRESGTVSSFKVEPKGPLSPIACAGTDCDTGKEPLGAAVSPDGKLLYVSNTESNSVSAFAIGEDGVLSPAPCVGCETGEGPAGIVVSPESSFLFAADSVSSAISPFSIGEDGALTALACAPGCSTGSGAYFQSLAITPDQAPTAAFTDTLGAAFSESTFNAGTSTASAGESITRYEWNFGDGSGVVTSSTPEVHHVFLMAQPYTVTLTVTDSAGCSTQTIFTGQTASCNGSSSAQHSASVTVPTFSTSISTSGKSKFNFGLFGKGSISPTRVKLTLSNLRQSAARWREGTALAQLSSSKRPPIGTRFSFDLSQYASLTFTFFRSLPGRRVAKKCVAPSRRNEHAHRCLRSVLAGTLKLAAGAGLSRVRFDGLLSRHKRLSPGSYTLVLSATSATGVHATTTALRFTIAKPSG